MVVIENVIVTVTVPVPVIVIVIVIVTATVTAKANKDGVRATTAQLYLGRDTFEFDDQVW